MLDDTLTQRVPSYFYKFPLKHAQHLELWQMCFLNPVPIDVKKVHPFAKAISKGNPEDNDNITVDGNTFIFNLGYDVFVVPDEEWSNPNDKDKATYTLYPHTSKTFSTGIKVATPPNWGFLIRDRSGMGIKDVVHTAGVIEGTYRNEWKIHLINHSHHARVIKCGDKIVQAVLTPIYPALVNEVEELPDTTRGEKGFGSSGR